MGKTDEPLKEGGIITEGDLRKVFWRSFPLQASFNYERMQNVGFCYSLLPILKKLYPNKDDMAAALKRHLSFFNTTPQVVTLITGACVAMEEENAQAEREGGSFDMESIAALKAALMGPVAGIGDSFFWGTFRVIAAGVGCGLAAQGSILGAILFLLIFNVPALLARAYGLKLRPAIFRAPDHIYSLYPARGANLYHEAPERARGSVLNDPVSRLQIFEGIQYKKRRRRIYKALAGHVCGNV